MYLTSENRQYIKELGIRHIGNPLGRLVKQQQSNYEKRKAQKEAAERNQIEGKFGLSKRKYRMNKIYAKTKETAESWIIAIVFITNLAR